MENSNKKPEDQNGTGTALSRRTYNSPSDLKRRKPLKWWHEAIIDDMLAHPLDTLEVRGQRLGYTGAYLSVIINSDMFKAHYNHRRNQHTAKLHDSIAHKSAKAADVALTMTIDKMEQKRSSLSFNQLADFTHKTLDRLGYGVKAPSGPGVTVNVNNSQSGGPITAEGLAEARAALRAAESARVVDAPVETIEEIETLVVEEVDAGRSLSNDE